MIEESQIQPIVEQLLQKQPQQQQKSKADQFILQCIKQKRPIFISTTGISNIATKKTISTKTRGRKPIIQTETYHQLKRQAAIDRKYYQEELKKKCEEQLSEEESDDNLSNQINEQEFKPNSAFLKQYRQRLIGRSSNSKIFELKYSDTDLPAGKVIKLINHKLSHLHQSECHELKNEFKILSKIKHENIISLGFEEFVQDKNFCGIILPQAKFNLMQFAKNQRHGKVNLSLIRVAFKQIAQAVYYLHTNYISHNDIKPDNIFIFDEISDFKLADFGFSVLLPKPGKYKRNSVFQQNLRKINKYQHLKKEWKLRCKQYVAPELIKVLNGKRPRTPSDEKSNDVFALGVSFFIVIFYQLPFCGSARKTDQRYKHFYKEQQEKFWSQFKSILAKLSQQDNSFCEEMKDLFNKILEPDHKKRYSIEQVIEHPWLNH